MKYPFIDKTPQEAQYRVTGLAFFEDIKIAYPYPQRSGLYELLWPAAGRPSADPVSQMDSSHYDLAKDGS